MVVLDRGGNRRRGRGSFEGEFGASHCNQWGLLLHSCAKMHEPIEMRLGVGSGVSQGIGVLEGGLHASRGRKGFGVFLPCWFEWSIF